VAGDVVTWRPSGPVVSPRGGVGGGVIGCGRNCKTRVSAPDGATLVVIVLRAWGSRRVMSRPQFPAAAVTAVSAVTRRLHLGKWDASWLGVTR